MTETNEKKRHREASDSLCNESIQNSAPTFQEIVFTLNQDHAPSAKRPRGETEVSSVSASQPTPLPGVTQSLNSSSKPSGRIIKLNRESSRLSQSPPPLPPLPPRPPLSSSVPSDVAARRQHIRALIVQEALQKRGSTLHKENSKEKEDTEKTEDEKRREQREERGKVIEKEEKEKARSKSERLHESDEKKENESKKETRERKKNDRDKEHEREGSEKRREETGQRNEHRSEESHRPKDKTNDRENVPQTTKAIKEETPKDRRRTSKEKEIEQSKKSTEGDRSERDRVQDTVKNSFAPQTKSSRANITEDTCQSQHSNKQSKETESEVERRSEGAQAHNDKDEDKVTSSHPESTGATPVSESQSSLSEQKRRRWESPTRSPLHSPAERRKRETKGTEKENDEQNVKAETKWTTASEVANTTPRRDATPTPTVVTQSTPTRTPTHFGTTSRSESRLRLTHHLEGCRSVENFEKIGQIGDGAYGVVFKARDKATGEIVALKKVKMDREKEGFPITSLREIKILMQCKHKNIVDVKEIVVGKGLNDIFIVMEYCEHDLKSLMSEMKSPFTISEVKCLMIQLLSAVEYLHENWIIHRDIKTSNLLLTNSGIFKLADFGLAREYSSPVKVMTPGVVTLWYRAPELLLGQSRYTTAIDMWSVGCVFGELLQNEPLFPGKSEFKQLDLMFKLLGTANERIWPGFSDLPNAKTWNFVHQPYNNLRRKFPQLSDYGFDLLNRLLTYDPDKRITAREALRHPFFEESPLPKDPEMMPTFRSKNDTNQSHISRLSQASGNNSPQHQIVLDIDREYEMQERTYAATTFQLNRAQ
jgi:cell division cycle 2-like protein